MHKNEYSGAPRIAFFCLAVSRVARGYKLYHSEHCCTDSDSQLAELVVNSPFHHIYMELRFYFAPIIQYFISNMHLDI